MIKRSAIFLLLMLSAVISNAADRILYMTESGTVYFRSDAPQEIIHATSKKLKGVIDPVKKTFAFRVSLQSFEGFNSPLQEEHFNEKYLETDRFPDAVFTGKIIEDVDLTKDGTYDIRAKGKLVIHGVESERIIRSSVTIKNGNADVNSIFTVQLNDHNIKVPKIVHEKVATEISIEIKALMKKQ